VSRGVLDTSVLVATDLHPLPGELAISVISVAELQFGVLVAKNPQARAKRLSRLGAIQRRFEPLPVDEVVADSYGQLAAQVAAIGRQPRTRSMDLLIAATAHAHGATLYTRNAKDFHGLESLVEVIAV
jgi:predicted nucleic acid-binding protein